MRIAFFVGVMFVLSVAGFAQTAGQITGQVTDRQRRHRRGRHRDGN